MIRRMKVPLGYNPKDLQLAAMVARYHRGALPSTSQKGFARLSAAQQRRTLLLAGILRLADSLDANPDGSIKAISVGKQDSCLVIAVEGYNPLAPSAVRVAVARHPLETLYNMPVVVRPQMAAAVEPRHARKVRLSNGKWEVQSKISGSRSVKKAV